MKKYIAFYLFAILTVMSCASEKFNTSPLYTTLNNENKFANISEKSFENSIESNLNASEITNIISTFPTFTNDAVNTEVLKMKTHLQNYLYAYQAYNITGKDRELRNFEKSYKKIQRLRKNLNIDENDLVNRYLVRLKTNLSQLENANLARP